MSGKWKAAARLATGIVVLACYGAEPGDQFKLKDFPPSPFDLKVPSRPWPEPDPAIENVDRDVRLQPVTTNQAEIALIEEVTGLRSRLLDLEAGVEAVDPLRRTYGQYIETAHDWVMKKHAREFWTGNRYFSSAAPTSAKQRAGNQIRDLVDMALYKDVASNTNFTPLLRSVFEAMERKAPGQFSASYARNDALIGFHPGESPKPAESFEAYLAELDQRYGLVLAKLEQIQKQEEIPSEVVRGWMYGDLYRLLDGAAQMYVMLTTPEQVNKLREELRGKTIKLSRLQASGH